jgi:hypothetical protein
MPEIKRLIQGIAPSADPLNHAPANKPLQKAEFMGFLNCKKKIKKRHLVATA